MVSLWLFMRRFRHMQLSKYSGKCGIPTITSHVPRGRLGIFEEEMPSYLIVPLARTTDVFELLRDQSCIGIIWRENSVWYAHPYSLRAPSILALTREDAAEQLKYELRAAA